MSEPIRLSDVRGKATLAASILGSGMAFVDSSAVNVALPTIGRELGAGFAEFQWIVNAYLLALSALVLPGGALADLHGRRRVFLLGVVGFGAASVLCGLAPTPTALIVVRAVQGVGAALAVPASLALLQSTLHPDDRGRAIGYWSGLSGISVLIGPLLGGWLADQVSWRAVFFINPPLATLVVLTAWKWIPGDGASGDAVAGGRGERAGGSERQGRRRSVDTTGAVTAVAALGGLVFFLIQGPEWGWSDPKVLAAAALSVIAAVAFVDVERSQARPMLPLEFFRSRQFSGANGVTLLVYFVLGGAFFLLTLQLQRVLGYSALEAGAAAAPTTLFLLVLSPLSGRWADRRGARLPMTVGPLAAAGGLLLLAGMGTSASYWTGVLPGVCVFGLGLGITVAPLTATALGALDDRHAGLASGVNNAVARVGQLLAIPLLPLAAGLGGIEELGGPEFADGFGRAMRIGAAVLVAGGTVAWLAIRGEQDGG